MAIRPKDREIPDIFLLLTLILIFTGCSALERNGAADLAARVRSGLQPSFESALLALHDCKDGEKALQAIWEEAGLEDRRRMFSILNKTGKLTAVSSDSVFDYCIEEMLEGILELGRDNLRACVKKLDMKIAQRASHWLAKGNHCLNYEIMSALPGYYYWPGEPNPLFKSMPSDEQVRHAVGLAVKDKEWECGPLFLDLAHLSSDEIGRGLETCLQDERKPVRYMAVRGLIYDNVSLLKKHADRIVELFRDCWREPPGGPWIFIPSEHYIKVAADALGCLDDEESRDLLIGFLENSNFYYDDVKYELMAVKALLARDDCDIETAVDHLSYVASVEEEELIEIAREARELLVQLWGKDDTYSDKVENQQDKLQNVINDMAENFGNWYVDNAQYISLDREKMVLRIDEDAKRTQVPVEKWKEMSDEEKAAALKAVGQEDNQNK
jgi:hypothetical protein